MRTPPPIALFFLHPPANYSFVHLQHNSDTREEGIGHQPACSRIFSITLRNLDIMNTKASKKTIAAFALGTLILVGNQLAHADQLDDVKKRGTLVCGVLGSVPPFGYQDPKTREPVGYDIEMCKLIAQHLKVKPEVKVIAVAARIPEVSQGRVDIVAGALGWTPARAEQIDFSYAYYKTLTVLGFPASAAYTSWDQFAGKRIGAGSATTSAAAAKEKIPQATLVTFDDIAQVLLALRQGKIDAVALNEIFLQQYKKRMQNTPDAINLLVDPPLFAETYGLGIKKGEGTLVEAVNQALLDADKKGELDKIFDKFVGKDSEFNMVRRFKVEKIAP
jgi:polar amino acid transport system substrate-binding protein